MTKKIFLRSKENQNKKKIDVKRQQICRNYNKMKLEQEYSDNWLIMTNQDYQSL